MVYYFIDNNIDGYMSFWYAWDPSPENYKKIMFDTASKWEETLVWKDLESTYGWVKSLGPRHGYFAGLNACAGIWGI